MGQTLTEPVTVKETSKCSNEKFKVGSSCMQGWRINMEDSHTHILSLPEYEETSFFGVYDGHGGTKVANYLGKNLHMKIISHPLFENGKIDEAIKQTFLSMDDEMLKNEETKDDLTGSTANVILVKNNFLICANVGDSRAIVSVNGQAEELSCDHKPTNQAEASRIAAAGGYIEFNRVNGNLALSRAFGDYIFKKNSKISAENQMVTAYPDVTITALTPNHEFVIMACDGIWDVMTSQEVVDFVRARIAQSMEPDVICEELMTRCLAPNCQMGGLGCDNMTVILICFIENRDYSQLSSICMVDPVFDGQPRYKQYFNTRPTNNTPNVENVLKLIDQTTSNSLDKAISNQKEIVDKPVNNLELNNEFGRLTQTEKISQFISNQTRISGNEDYNGNGVGLENSLRNSKTQIGESETENICKTATTIEKNKLNLLLAENSPKEVMISNINIENNINLSNFDLTAFNNSLSNIKDDYITLSNDASVIKENLKNPVDINSFSIVPELVNFNVKDFFDQLKEEAKIFDLDKAF